LGLNPSVIRGQTLESAEAQERIVRYRMEPGSRGDGLEDVQTSEAWRNQIGVVVRGALILCRAGNDIRGGVLPVMGSLARVS